MPYTKTRGKYVNATQQYRSQCRAQVRVRRLEGSGEEGGESKVAIYKNSFTLGQEVCAVSQDEIVVS
jgi:hypothetical protein